MTRLLPALVVAFGLVWSPVARADKRVDWSEYLEPPGARPMKVTSSPPAAAAPREAKAAPKAKAQRVAKVKAKGKAKAKAKARAKRRR